MPYDVLEQKIKTLPQEAVKRIFDYVDEIYAIYKAEKTYTDAERLQIAHSLFGILPATVTLEEAREERLNAI